MSEAGAPSITKSLWKKTKRKKWLKRTKSPEPEFLTLKKIDEPSLNSYKSHKILDPFKGEIEHSSFNDQEETKQDDDFDSL